jgi:hypothetical protein
MPSRKLLVCLLVVASTLISTPNATVATTHDNLVGAWKLVSYENHTAGAPIDYPYGVKPAGLLIYDSSGHMAIQIMKTPPQKVASGDEYHLTPEEKIALMDGYVAYFGTYEVDWTKHVVTVTAHGDLYSVYVGAHEERPFVLEGDRLTLTPRWEQDGKWVQGIRVFERVKKSVRTFPRPN